MKEFTPEELFSFDGKEGRPVYVAFEGKVYDLSDSPHWTNGLHMGRHPSGKDLTGAISAAPHGAEVLKRHSQVGVIQKGFPEKLKHLPSILQGLFQRFPMAKRHPHPMFVHFPIAFFMGSSFFVLLYLIFDHPSFETASFYLLNLGALSSPFAVGTGLLTWWVNYQGKVTRLIKKKIQFSILLLLLSFILIIWRISTPEISSPIYFILILGLTPVVALLGYFGGQMTFPAE